MTRDEALAAIHAEAARAADLHQPMHSCHEAIAVIEEEFLELRETVFRAKRGTDDLEAKRKEAVQLGAMVVRFLTDVL